MNYKPYLALIIFSVLILSPLFLSTACLQSGYSQSGTSSQYSSSSESISNNPQVQNLDREIAKIREQIEETRDDLRNINTQIIMAGEHHNKSRGWIRDANDIYDPAINQVARNTKHALAGEKKLEQLRRKLEQKKQERQEVLEQSTGCFPPDTLVQTADGGVKPFTLVQKGDLVMTYDIGSRCPVGRKVIKLYQVKANHLYVINGELMTTAGERLLTAKGWKEIAELKTGEQIHVNGCMKKIDSIEYIRTNKLLYNMQVNATHNFYIQTKKGNRYLVHNTCGGGSGGGGSK